MVKDPVCGMYFDMVEAEGQSEYQGTTYYFCCMECKDAFDAEPAHYALAELV